MRPRSLSFASLFLVAACNAGVGTSVGFGGSSATNGSNASNGSNGSNGATTNGVGPAGSTSTGFGAATAGAGGGSNGCSAASQLVYVFTIDNKIYSFNPPTKTFTYVATPDCPATSQANSMAIDRNLVAWINYIGEIDTFDLNTKSGCKKAMGLQPGYTQVGMGFSTDQAGGTTETLYVDGIGGSGLARVNTSTKTLTPIGAFSNDPNLSGQSCELTGTGSAKLFGYFTTSPNVRVAELDKTNGNSVSDHELVGVSPPQDWAWSFWGGDFYLYAAPGNNATGNSSVIKYQPSTGAVDMSYVADAGFKIVGAGVSTCAPTMPM